MTDFTKGRATLYKGVRMRSRLEADYAAYLDDMEQPWEYEPICFASDAGQWLPDFGTVYPDSVVWPRYIEVKPAQILKGLPGDKGSALQDRIDVILRRMSVAWSSEPRAILELTFWQYGVPDPVLRIIAHPDSPWMAYPRSGVGLFSVLWAGMGQREALPPANPRASEVSR